MAHALRVIRLPFVGGSAANESAGDAALALGGKADGAQIGFDSPAHVARPCVTYLILTAAELRSLIPVESIWQYMRDNWLSNRVFL
jgi:hypothetical protein